MIRRLFLLALTVYMTAFLTQTPLTYALSKADVRSILNNTAFYDPADVGGQCSGTSTGSSGGPIVGDLKGLAQQIISNPNVTYDGGPSGITSLQFKRISQGQKAQTDDGREVDVEPIVLVVVLHLAQSHKVNVSALTDGSSHTAPTNPHGSGKGVDVSQLDATHTNGTDSIAASISSIAAEVLPTNSRFGLGDNGGLRFGPKQIGGKSFVTFMDFTNHVHIDVLGVSQADDDAAVTAAGSGGTPPTTTTTAGDASPVGGNASCCATGNSGASTPLIGSSAGEQVFNFFISKGLPNDSAAAATGNLELESGFITNEWASNGHYGLAQWDRVDRYPQLLNFAGSIDNASKIQPQLEFIWHELTVGYTSTLTNLKGSGTVTEKAIFWGRHYEGAVNPDGSLQGEQQRVADAIKWASKAPGVPAGAGASITSTSGSACAPAEAQGTPGKYANPFHSTKGLIQSRIDEGVDYASSSPVPLYAIGNGVVTVSTDKSTFFTTSGGHADWITYQLIDGPAAGKYVYVSEACPPLVKVGDKISTATHLCDVLSDSIEMGWALNGSSQVAAASVDYRGQRGFETVYGVNFNQLLVSLGAPSGHLDAASDPTGQVVGTLPSGWPTWK